MELDRHGDCPECGESWDAGDIPKEIRKHYSKPYKWSHLVGIEVREKYDGVSYWQCPFCNVTWNRFTGKLEEVKNV